MQGTEEVASLGSHGLQDKKKISVYHLNFFGSFLFFRLILLMRKEYCRNKWIYFNLHALEYAIPGSYILTWVNNLKLTPDLQDNTFIRYWLIQPVHPIERHRNLKNVTCSHSSLFNLILQDRKKQDWTKFSAFNCDLLLMILDVVHRHMQVAK